MITSLTDDQNSQIPTINALMRSLSAYFLFTPDYTLTVGLTLRITGGHVPGAAGADVADQDVVLPAGASAVYVQADATTHAITANTSGYASGAIKIGIATTNSEGMIRWQQDFVATAAP